MPKLPHFKQRNVHIYKHFVVKNEENNLVLPPSVKALLNTTCHLNTVLHEFKKKSDKLFIIQARYKELPTYKTGTIGYSSNTAFSMYKFGHKVKSLFNNV